MAKFLEKFNLTPKQVFDILLLTILIIFIGQNVESVKVKFLFFGLEVPLIIIIVISFLIGFYTSKVFSRKKKHNQTEETENEGEEETKK